MTQGRESGRAIAVGYAAEGAAVVVADIQTAGAQQTVEQIERAGGRALFVETDVTRSADAQRVTAAAVEAFGRVDVLVNNAAIGGGDDILATDAATWDRVVAVVLKSVFLCTRAVLPRMIAQRREAIVNSVDNPPRRDAGSSHICDLLFTCSSNVRTVVAGAVPSVWPTQIHIELGPIDGSSAGAVDRAVTCCNVTNNTDAAFYVRKLKRESDCHAEEDPGSTRWLWARGAGVDVCIRVGDSNRCAPAVATRRLFSHPDWRGPTRAPDPRASGSRTLSGTDRRQSPRAGALL
jgi:ATP-dependent Clp protease adapter protein ClpS